MKEKFEKFDFRTLVKNLPKTSIEELTTVKNPIIFDTNFLFVPFEFKLDIIEELKRLIGTQYSLYIYEGTLGELEAVERKGDKNKKFLPLITKMLELYKFKVITSKQTYIDDQLLEENNKDYIIATNDKELRLKLKSQGKKIILLRQKSYLTFF